MGTNEILSVLIDRECDGVWETLSEQTITNSYDWLGLKFSYVATGPYKLGFEGSLEYGASLFVDDVKVSMQENTSSLKILKEPDNADASIYTLTGVKVSQEIMHSHPGIYIQNGKKVIIH